MQPRVGVVEDALLAPQLVGPRPDALQPERRLRVAVLALALGEYQKYADAKDVWNRHRFAEVEAWFMSDEADWPFSFAAICEALGLDVSYVRAGVRGRQGRLLIALPGVFGGG
jgi:hypothetical protein